MNKTSKFLLSGAAVYANAFTSIYYKNALKGQIPTLQELVLNCKSVYSSPPYSLKNAYNLYNNKACMSFVGYKIGETFSGESLTSKVICAFIGRFAVEFHHSIDFSKKSLPKLFIDGLTSAALAYIWHEDASDQRGESVELSQNITEDGSL
jgi:hypothetical protein